jgi:ribulose-phosphate 3-epimerase
MSTLPEILPTISVGILTADLLSLGSEIALLEQAGVKLVHFDVMDGSFVPLMTVGPPLIQAVKTTMLKDVHLMIDQPLNKLQDYWAAGADILTVHAEAGPHVHRALQQMRDWKSRSHPDAKLVRGLALNPGTPVEVLEPLLDELELVTVLAVNPGWGGQEFIPATAQRLAKVKQLIGGCGRPIWVSVDGGVRRDNMAAIARMGADIVVTGSAVFDGKNPVENARHMLQVVQVNA